MCTVTYLPRGNNQFILTSNRDENRLRTAAQIVKKTLNDGQVLTYPKDPMAGGTWICVSNQDRLICVLNGAFEYHERNLPYGRSRGLVALDFFEHACAEAFFADYDFTHIEAFTMVIYDQGKLYDVRWDEQQLYTQALATDKPHIWASATLYTPEVRAKRCQWFSEWLAKKPPFEVSNILQFHKFGGEGDEANDLVMNRLHLVETVSITAIEKNPRDIQIHYHDLIKPQTIKAQIDVLYPQQVPQLCP